MSQMINNLKDTIINFVILRNITIETIKRPLIKSGFESGFNINLNLGGFDTALQDAIEENNLLNEQTHIVVVLLNIKALSNLIEENFTSLNDTDVIDEIARIKQYYHTTVSGIKHSAPHAKILIHNIEYYCYPLQRMSNDQLLRSQNSVVKILNDNINQLVDFTGDCYLIDSNLTLQELGISQFYDMRYWYHARAPYGQKALISFSRQYTSLVRELFGKTNKCLILDCDNTLWGGIIGEDGINKILLDDQNIGAAFKSFQKLIYSLSRSGVIIALCSKNNEQDVWQVFDSHPHMVLTRALISEYQINWDNKANNIIKIAQALNIGIDSCVFVDDNAFEINLVQSALPSIKTLLLDKANPSNYTSRLLQSNYFSKIDILEEDSNKTMMYQQQQQRNKHQITTSIDDYISSLHMVIEINVSCDESIKRIAQISQKTNQFNLTTHRYSESEIYQIHLDLKKTILTISLQDRFGNLGIVGYCIYQLNNDDTIEITDFALSCRALGRKVEYIFIDEVLKPYKHKVCLSSYIPSEKNNQVRNFYDTAGFIIYSKNKFGSKNYKLKKHTTLKPTYMSGIKVINNFKEI